ncbi:MAG: DUF92 domain-containing protein [Anaerolineae bacterium]|nr:DUF92 domain-containing protein [Anaerolineae bacterium]
MSPLQQLFLGLIISGLIGYAGYRKRALSLTGWAGAILVGTTIFGAGGWIWGMLLITFFVLSSALSAYKKAVKQQLAEKFAKGACRDLAQTLANGGCGALLALAARFHPQPALLAAFVGALATVNADTWATELGVLSSRPPRLVTTGRVVEPGTSGGVSLLGTLATLAGGLSIGLAAALFLLLDKALGGPGYAHLGADTAVQGTLVLLPVATLGGLIGSLCDSLLGATLQTIYYSTRRAKETEREIDPDGIPNEHLRGWKWLNNDWVNFLSSAVGAAISVLVWKALLA